MGARQGSGRCDIIHETRDKINVLDQGVSATLYGFEVSFFSEIACKSLARMEGYIERPSGVSMYPVMRVLRKILRLRRLRCFILDDVSTLNRVAFPGKKGDEISVSIEIPTY